MDLEGRQCKIIETDSIFMGLNNRAVNFLLQHGDWYKLTDLEQYGYTGDFGMLFISEGESEDDPELAELAGCLYKDFVIPTIVYSWYPYTTDDDPNNVKTLPIYKYRVRSDEDESIWLYEKVEDKSSDLYKHIKLICLTDEEGNSMFEWTDEELELSELMLEYTMGW